MRKMRDAVTFPGGDGWVWPVVFAEGGHPLAMREKAKNFPEDLLMSFPLRGRKKTTHQKRVLHYRTFKSKSANSKHPKWVNLGAKVVE